ncbi:hypothetical protein DFH27DRAFT_611409 [Peziza echinospora]|nr:hypothetical protein DFH27DRAFT_611409 [Peziza echinospora]
MTVTSKSDSTCQVVSLLASLQKARVWSNGTEISLFSSHQISHITLGFVSHFCMGMIDKPASCQPFPGLLKSLPTETDIAPSGMLSQNRPAQSRVFGIPELLVLILRAQITNDAAQDIPQLLLRMRLVCRGWQALIDTDPCLLWATWRTPPRPSNRSPPQLHDLLFSQLDPSLYNLRHGPAHFANSLTFSAFRWGAWGLDNPRQHSPQLYSASEVQKLSVWGGIQNEAVGGPDVELDPSSMTFGSFSQLCVSEHLPSSSGSSSSSSGSAWSPSAFTDVHPDAYTAASARVMWEISQKRYLYSDFSHSLGPGAEVQTFITRPAVPRIDVVFIDPWSCYLLKYKDGAQELVTFAVQSPTGGGVTFTEFLTALSSFLSIKKVSETWFGYKDEQYQTQQPATTRYCGPTGDEDYARRWMLSGVPTLIPSPFPVHSGKGDCTMLIRWQDQLDGVRPGGRYKMANEVSQRHIWRPPKSMGLSDADDSDGGGGAENQNTQTN